MVDSSAQRGFTRVLDFIEAVADSHGVRDPAVYARGFARLNIVFTSGLVASGDCAGLVVMTGLSRHLHRLILASIVDHAPGSPADG